MLNNFSFGIPGARERYDKASVRNSERVVCVVGRVRVTVWTSNGNTYCLDRVVADAHDDAWADESAKWDRVSKAVYGIDFDPIMFRALALEWLPAEVS